MVAAVQAHVRAALPIDRYIFAAGTVTGYSVQDAALSAEQQSVIYIVPSTGNGASVALYPPGKLRLTPGYAAPVSVNGRPGFFGSLRMRLADIIGNDAFAIGFPDSYLSRTVTIVGVLAWQYQPEAWALVYSRGAELLPTSLPPTAGDAARLIQTPLSRREGMRIAEAIHLGRARSVKVPARFTNVPPGLTLQRIGFFGVGSAGAFYEFGSGRSGRAALFVAVSNDVGTGTKRGIPVTVHAFRGRYVRGSRQPVLFLIHRRVEIDFSIYRPPAAGTHSSPRPSTDLSSLTRLRPLAAGMVIARDITDHATWFKASTATN